MKREHKLTIGRYQVTGEFDAVKLDDGTYAMTSADFDRLGLEAAILVLSQPQPINGGELKFARKAMDLGQENLATLLEVPTERVRRWEAGTAPIRRQTQLSILHLLQHTARHGVHPLTLLATWDSDMRFATFFLQLESDV